MQYKDVLHPFDTLKAFALLGIELHPQGKSAKFACPKCDATAVITTYGDRKNLIFCPKCRFGSNLIKLTMEHLKADRESATAFLKDAMDTGTALTIQLDFSYDLEHTNLLEDAGISPEFCKEMGIGQPKGNTMFADCTAFAVRNEVGTLVTYYGLTKDGTPKVHKSFSPEHYLYNFDKVDREGIIVLCPDILACAKMASEGTPAICNFGLTYLSPRHIELLNTCKLLDLRLINEPEIIRQSATTLRSWMRFNL